MACAYYYGSTMCNSMLSDTYHNNNNNTKAAVHMYRVDSSLTRVSSCLLSYEPPRYEIEVLREATLLLYDKTCRVLALHGPSHNNAVKIVYDVGKYTKTARQKASPTGFM